MHPKTALRLTEGGLHNKQKQHRYHFINSVSDHCVGVEIFIWTLNTNKYKTFFQLALLTLLNFGPLKTHISINDDNKMIHQIRLSSQDLKAFSSF